MEEKSKCLQFEVLHKVSPFLPVFLTFYSQGQNVYVSPWQGQFDKQKLRKCQERNNGPIKKND